MADSKPVLTQERLREILNYDPETGEFTYRVRRGAFTPGKPAGNVSKKGHVKIYVDRQFYAAHRLAWLYVYGEFPEKYLDHINRIRHDNRISNLREVTPRENNENMSPSTRGKSGYPGVYWIEKSGRWIARINAGRKQYQVGQFLTKDEAMAARKAAELKYHPLKTQTKEPA